MNGKQTWYGYLEAGSKSSPVAIDSRWDTGNPKTQFIFNMARREILEYSREIVTPKLRDLHSDEATDMLEDLQHAYRQVQSAFRPRGGRPVERPEPIATNRRERAHAEREEVLDFKTDEMALDGVDD
jgi:hypothetical protein